MARPSSARSSLRFIRTLAGNARGATAVEYALLLAMIAITIAASLSQITMALRATFDLIGGYLFVAR